MPGLRSLRVGRGPFVTAGMVIAPQQAGDHARLHHRAMTVEHPPVVIRAGRHWAFWAVVRLIGLLIALLILPVLIALNLLLYLVILPTVMEAIIG